MTERPGYLRLKTGKVVTGIFEARNTLTQRTEGPKCSGVVSLDLTNMKDGDCAGLAAFCSEPGTLTVTQEGGKKYLLMTDRGVEKARVEINQNQLYLKMVVTLLPMTHYSLTVWMIRNGCSWAISHMIFSMAHFTGNKFAIFNYATRETGGYVDVDFFRYNK